MVDFIISRGHKGATFIQNVGKTTFFLGQTLLRKPRLTRIFPGNCQSNLRDRRFIVSYHCGFRLIHWDGRWAARIQHID